MGDPFVSFEAALRIQFRNALRIFRQAVRPRTAAMHSGPLSDLKSGCLEVQFLVLVQLHLQIEFLWLHVPWPCRVVTRMVRMLLPHPPKVGGAVAPSQAEGSDVVAPFCGACNIRIRHRLVPNLEVFAADGTLSNPMRAIAALRCHRSLHRDAPSPGYPNGQTGVQYLCHVKDEGDHR